MIVGINSSSTHDLASNERKVFDRERGTVTVALTHPHTLAHPHTLLHPLAWSIPYGTDSLVSFLPILILKQQIIYNCSSLQVMIKMTRFA